MRFLRDVCEDNLTNPHSNPCIDTTYFFNTGNRHYSDFANGRNIVFQGFSNDLSNILELNPTMPVLTTAHLGDGNEEFIYTNGFVISKANCDHSCLITATSWLNWSKANHALITSLGLDLTPQRPRYLLMSWAPFYDLPQTKAYHPYHKMWKMQRNGQAQNIDHLLDTQDAQFAALSAALLDGYTPP